VVRAVLHSRVHTRRIPQYHPLALQGRENVFLQDANNLAHRTKDLVEILTYLKKTFSTVQRITTYSGADHRAQSLEELQALHDAGLSRIHVGLESGYDRF